MEKKLDAILEYLELLKQGQARLEEKMDNLSSETRSGFKHVEENLEGLMTATRLLCLYANI
ncbi:hypothetical protein [Alkalihalobacillus sp. TS-13]|uniref:hypothetical protein n=1 Tax=Alkalihalobacillus sp. TS-13 TaxID=2842455 RepID=UPI001C875A22|nr:hypothetical protein [Alkalihalobacillus sp. TS-13]